MKITIFTLLLCLFFTITTTAQTTYSIKGTVADSSSTNLHLANTSVLLLNAKDSTLREFTRTAANGTFSLTKFTKGKYIILMTYPGYADYVEHFTADSLKPQRDLGKVYLTLKSKILKEVMIKGTVAAIKIKGDTTIFDPRAYTIQPNSKVEDLLKQLPGIQVDKDGKITAQGKAVPKVLVDGEEFFGDDPTLVTKNIRGDMVDKIQLYDKASDQAAFTGVDDGNKTKTINIMLKEDKKNGYFGKLDAEQGTDKYYQNQAMYNKFKGKKKFSVYGVLANTGKIGLGWSDNSKYGSAPEGETDDDGNTYFYSNGDNDLDSFNGRYSGQGIPVARSGGAHYDAKWDGDKKSLNTNYKIGYLAVTGTRNNLTQNNLPNSFINSNSDDSFNNSMFRQKLDFAYLIKLDTSSTLKISVDGTISHAKTADNFISSSRNVTDKLLNNNNRGLTNDADGQIFNASALYTHKFKKKGRTLSWNVSQGITRNDANGFLNSVVNYYNTTSGAIDSIQRTDQRKTNLVTSAVTKTNITYTEPLSKGLSLVLNYGLNYNNSNADRKSFNALTPGVYTILDTRFSNDYTFNQLANQAGAVFNYKTLKSTFNIGTRATIVNFKQVNKIVDTVYRRSFINWNPQATYQYRFSQQSSIRINYSGRPQQPTIDQIQPVRVNTDPLNITLGNPNLKPAFDNSFGLNYNSYKVLSDKSLYMYSQFTFTSNAIASNTTRDTTGKSTYQSINLSGKTPYTFYGGLYYGQKVKFGGINAGLDANTNGNVTYTYINSVLNKTTSNSYQLRARISKYKENKYDFSISGGPGYTVSGSSLNPQINNNGYTFNGDAYSSYYLPKKFMISTDANYDYRGKTQTFNETFSRVIWNASFSKKLLKDDKLKLAITANDILNQNQGFDRYASNGTITQNSYTTIKRYFMFTATFDFSQMGAGAPKK